MSRFNRSIVLSGASTLLFAASLFAAATTPTALVDDNEDGTNSNEFENYWYYYDDNSGVKEDDRPTAGAGTDPSVINVEFVLKNREAFGDVTDTYKVKEYTFVVKEESGNKFAMMPFTYGEKWVASWCTEEACAYPFVGIGTMLAPDGKSIDLTGATSVSFKLRSRVNKLDVWFKVETKDIGDDSTFAHYQYKCEVTAGTWTEFTVPFTDLAQPAWATGEREAEFSQNLCCKLAWGVSMEDNTDVTSDTLDVDQVVINNYTFVSPTVWTKVEAAPPATVPPGLFAHFETAPKNATPLKTYWYAYNDGEIGGTSQVLQGATLDSDTTKRLTLDLATPGSGADNSTGAYLKATLGPSVKQTNPTGTVDVQGFVGIGFNTYDSTNSTYWNAATGVKGTLDFDGATNSIYFEYNCSGDFKYLTLEISDSNDVGDMANPTRKDKRGSGIVWYRNFPNTNGAWVKVLIPFDSLITHSDWKGYVAIPLDKANLAKVQWKSQGAEGKSGMIAVDNVYFPGMDFKVGIADGNRNVSRPAANSAFNASYLNGAVMVNWNNSTGFTSGKISLFNTKGAVVANAPVTATSAIRSSISAAKLPAGMYFVQFNGIDTYGKTVSRQSAVSIVK